MNPKQARKFVTRTLCVFLLAILVESDLGLQALLSLGTLVERFWPYLKSERLCTREQFPQCLIAWFYWLIDRYLTILVLVHL